MPPGCWGLSLLVAQIKQELDPRLLLTTRWQRGSESYPCSRSQQVLSPLAFGNILGLRGLCQRHEISSAHQALLSVCEFYVSV